MTAALDFETQLHTIPVRNEKLRITPSEHRPDVVLVEVELRYGGLLAGLASFVNARKRKRYELTGLSREFFEVLDGKLTVENLIDQLCASDNLTFLESRALVTQYLRDLMQRGLIAIVPEESVMRAEKPSRESS